MAGFVSAVDTEGRREIIGLGIGPSEAETFWTEFLRSLRARGLGGVRLVISDAHTGLKAAIARVFEATWQRCRVHWMRNALAHVSRGQHTVVAAAILDRLMHDAIVFNIKGPSWRLREHQALTAATTEPGHRSRRYLTNRGTTRPRNPSFR